MAWNFRFFKRGHKHQWENHRGDYWDAHECEFPPEELWELGDEIQCGICGKVRRCERILSHRDGRVWAWLEWRIIEELCEELCDGNEPSC